MSTKALERHLHPLMPYLKMEGVTEICINQPGEVFVEKDRLFSRHILEHLDYDLLYSLAGLIAEFNHQDFPTPLLGGSLPTGERVQFVLSPACERGRIICSIRRHHMKEMSLANYSEAGAFSFSQEPNGNRKTSGDKQLLQFHKENKTLDFIKLAIALRKNILISGGTGTGKTTFLNACLKEIPNEERIITAEDTREIVIKQPNAVHLLFNEEDAQRNALKIFKACLRLRPDRIFLSELRGAEVWPYLRAANSGHPGSLSTLHADSPEGAFTQLVFMMQQAGSTSTEEQIRSYVKSIIPIVIQLNRPEQRDKFMSVSDIYFDATHEHYVSDSSLN